MRYLGFYLTSGSRTHVRFGFSTHAAAGANVAPNSAFEAADIRIYKATDGAALSATQRSSANGITMTSPFDSLTGVHTVDIDLTDNTDSGFYAAGSYYEVWLCPDETVDSQAITGICLGCFEIGVPTANVTQWLGTAPATPGTAGVPSVDAIRISTSSTAADNLETAALAYSATRGLAGTALPNAAADAAGGLIISDAGGLDADAQLVTKINDILTDTGTTLQGELDGIQADTEDIQAKIGTPSDFGSGTSTIAANLQDLADNGTATFDRSTDSLQAIRDRGDAAWITATGFATAAALATAQADLDTITGAAGVLIDSGTGAGQLSISSGLLAYNPAWDAEIQSEVADALGVYDPPTRAELTSDTNSILAELAFQILHRGLVGDTGNSTTAVHLNGLTYGNDEIIGYLLVVYDASEDEYHWRKITDWVLATELASVDALPFTPAENDGYALIATLGAADVTGGDATAANQATIIALLGTPADDIAADIAAVKVDTAAILVDTAEIGTAGAGLTNINLPNQTMDIVGNITGNLSGSVGSVTGNVGGSVASVTAGVTLANGAITDASLAGNMEIVFETDFATNYNTTNNRWAVSVDAWRGTDLSGPNFTSVTYGRIPIVSVVAISGDETAADTLELFAEALDQSTGQLDSGSLASGTITAASIASDAITDAKVASDVTIASVTGAVGSVTGNVGGNVTGSVGSVTNLTIQSSTILATGTHNPQTGDAYAALTSAVPDSVPADGSRPTVQQAVRMILQVLTEGGISGTTWTVKKEDGSTTLFTVTLDDDTTPTSKTRSG